NPTQPEKDGTIIPSRVASHPELAESAAGKQVTDPRRQGMAERGLEKFTEKFGHPFRRLDGDIAGKSIGDDDIYGTRSNVVPFDKAVKVDRRDGVPQSRARAADGVVSLEILRTYVEQPHSRLDQTQNSSSENITHQRELDEVLLVALDIGAQVQHHAFAPARGKE